MKKIFLILALGILFLNLVSAFSICVDKDPPSLANSSLNWTATSNTIQLSWIPATDIPSCSGIDHYDIYRSIDGINFSKVGSSPTNSYTDSGLSSGSAYYYMIHAFDLVGHNEANESLSHSVPISLIIESGNGGGSSGGGGGGHDDDSYWQCEEWSKCINGTQTRVCEDLEKNLPNRTESKTCFPDFIPLTYENQGENNNPETESINHESSSTNFLTGAVIGGVTNFAKSTTGIITFITLIGILTGLILVRRLKR